MDICDQLAGRYPKGFRWAGWHPNCRCYAVPIIKTDTEYLEDAPSASEVKDVPDNFKQWVKGNEERIAAARSRGTEPYFLRDNAKQVDKILAASNKPTPLEIAAQRHATRTPEQIADIQSRWNEHRILNLYEQTADFKLQTDPTFNELINLLKDDNALGEFDFFKKDYSELQAYIDKIRYREIGKTEALMQTPKFVENNKQLEKALGIKRETAMAFYPANELRGNPHYLANKTYRENCQTCVFGHEMRRRGFPVEALPNLKGSALEELSHATELAWIDENGHIPVPKRVGAIGTKKVNRWTGAEYYSFKKTCANRKQLVKALESEITEEGRYHISWSWNSINSGHIITVEKFDGVLRYYDPQNGQIITDIVDYIKDIQLATGIKLLRVDNLRANPAVFKNVLTKSGSKAIVGEAATEGSYNSLPKNQRKQILKDSQQWVRSNMPKVVLKDGNNAYRTSINNVSGNNIVVNQDYFNEVYAKNIMRNNLVEIMNIAKDFAQWMPRAKFVRQEAGEHHNFPFNVYEVTVDGKRIEVKTKLTNAEYLYTLRIK